MNRESLKHELKNVLNMKSPNAWHVTINSRKILKDYIFKTTEYLSDVTINERIYNILFDINDVKRCKKDGCTKPTKFQHFKRGYVDYCSISCARTDFKKIITNKKCIFGCNKKANYLLSGEKYCCESNFSKCPGVRDKNSIKNSGKNNAMYGKSAVKYSIHDWYERYPFFCKIEKPRLDINGQMIVKCKFCQKEFIPNRESIRSRRDALEHEDGNGGNYFYCSDDCKNKCPLFNLRPDYILNENINDIIKPNQRTIWRTEVFRRQYEEVGNNECEYCGNKNINELECHHEKPIKIFPLLALDPDNGIILCGRKSKNFCHMKIGHQDECSLGKIGTMICSSPQRNLNNG